MIGRIDRTEYETDYEISVSRFEEAISKYRDRYSTFMKHLEENKENYFMFIKYQKKCAAVFIHNEHSREFLFVDREGEDS